MDCGNATRVQILLSPRICTGIRQDCPSTEMSIAHRHCDSRDCYTSLGVPLATPLGADASFVTKQNRFDADSSLSAVAKLAMRLILDQVTYRFESYLRNSRIAQLAQSTNLVSSRSSVQSRLRDRNNLVFKRISLHEKQVLKILVHRLSLFYLL